MSKSLAVMMAVALAAPSMAVAGPYVGFGFGGARTESSLTDLGLYPSPVLVPDPGYPDPNFTGDDDFTSTDVSIDVTVGWMFTKHLGVEVGYTDFGSAEQRYQLPESCNVYGCQSREWTAKMEMTGVRAFVIGSVPINDKFDAFLKVGAMNWSADYSGLERNKAFVPDFPIGPRYDEISFDDDSTGFAAGMGVNLKTDSPFSVRAEINYYDVDSTDLVWNADLMAVYTF